MSRALVVMLALFAAVHVGVINIPAPVPVFLAASGVIFGLCFAIFESVHRGAPHWRAWA